MKVFERIVRKEMVLFLTTNNLLNPTQHGCLSALLDVYDNMLNIYVLLEGADHVDMIYLVSENRPVVI